MNDEHNTIDISFIFSRHIQVSLSFTHFHFFRYEFFDQTVLFLAQINNNIYICSIFRFTEHC